MTHPIWQLPILEGKSALVLTPCPGTQNVSLFDSLTQLKESGVEAIVTALQVNEMNQAGVQQLEEQTKALNMVWFHLPIEDNCAPEGDFAEQWKVVSPELHKIINQGGKVTLHCMGGSGRTGMLAAHLLLELDWDIETIMSEVKALRPKAFSKQAQIDYLNKIAEQ
jgi:protein-tyrosine phosphatase